MGLRYASVRSIKGKTYQQPIVATPSGARANVDLSKALLPANPLGTGAQTWASSPDGSSPINVVGGAAYPIQGLVTVLALRSRRRRRPSRGPRSTSARPCSTTCSSRSRPTPRPGSPTASTRRSRPPGAARSRQRWPRSTERVSEADARARATEQELAHRRRAVLAARERHGGEHSSPGAGPAHPRWGADERGVRARRAAAGRPGAADERRQPWCHQPGYRPGDTATALPAGIALGASFNPALARASGAMLGREARSRGSTSSWPAGSTWRATRATGATSSTCPRIRC